MTALTGTHKTKCMICGGKDNLVMQYDGKSMVDLCHSCAVAGVIIANRNSMMFIMDYVKVYRDNNPGCHYGSEFGDSCIEMFEEEVWLGFLRDWIKKNRRVY
jgi:hypothetical protein